MQSTDRQKLLTGVGLVRGAAYVQSNTDEQRPFWAESQVKQIGDWATRHGSQVEQCFVDLGVDEDTRLFERPGGAQLVEAVQRGEVEFVVVATYDQLGRFAEGVLATLQELVQLGALVVVIDGKMSPELQVAIGPVETIRLKPDTEVATDGCAELTLNEDTGQRRTHLQTSVVGRGASRRGRATA